MIRKALSSLNDSEAGPGRVRGSRTLGMAAAGCLLLLVSLRVFDLSEPKEPVLVAPLQPKRWLDLAQKLADRGNSERAKATLMEGRKEGGPLSALRLKAATLAIELGEPNLAFRDLRFVFRTDPERRRQAVYIAKSIWGEDGGLRLVPPHDPRLLAAYFDLALKEQWTAEATQVWERARREKIPLDLPQVRRYIQLLWEGEELEEARKVWNTLYGDEGIVWNGGFERELVGWGFGWKTHPQTGAGIRRDEKAAAYGKASLRISLAGLGVESDHVLAEQVLLLSPGGHYELRAKGRCEEITSSSGLVIEVADLETGTVWGTTPVLSGTTNWTEFTAPVELLPDASAASALRIKWKGTSEWEIPVYGTAWVDELEIVESASGIEFKGAESAPTVRTP